MPGAARYVTEDVTRTGSASSKRGIGRKVRMTCFDKAVRKISGGEIIELSKRDNVTAQRQRCRDSRIERFAGNGIGGDAGPFVVIEEEGSSRIIQRQDGSNPPLGMIAPVEVVPPA